MPEILDNTPVAAIAAAHTSGAGDKPERVRSDPAVDIARRINTGFDELTDTVNRVGEEKAVVEAGAKTDLRGQLDTEQFERATRGMGLSHRQKSAAGSRLGLRRTLNRATAQGDVRRGFTARSEAAAASSSSFADALFAQNQGANTADFAAKTLKNTQDARTRAQNSAAGMQTATSIIGAVLAFFSSEKLKHDHGHEGNLLKKLENVRVNRWQYKGDDRTHVGPFSEEFNREFGIDTDRPDMINVIDALGVTMGAIKELDKKVSAHAIR